MSVYVDDVRHRFGRMIMCHLWADSLDELLAVADAIGVQRKWIQGHSTLSYGKHRNPSWIHFDVSLTMKERAIARGAILTDKYGPVEHTSRLHMLSDNPAPAERGAAMLARVISIRGRGSRKTPLPIDQRRITKLAQACDLTEEEQPHGPFWKLRKAKAYAELGSACDLAGAKARRARDTAL